MLSDTNTAVVIEKILDQTKTIAVVGFSSKTSKAGYYVPAYLQKHGYHIIPVNPLIDDGLGETAYPNLTSVPEPIDLVLVFRLPQYVPPVVDEAIAIGAQAIWLQLGIWHDEAATKAQAAGLNVVQNACMLVEHRDRLGA